MVVDVVFGGIFDFVVQFGWLKLLLVKVVDYVKCIKD